MMDAVKFIEERERMCKMYSGCHECPGFDESGACLLGITTGASPSKQIELLEKWIAAHPIKTRQSVFLEQWPNAIVEYGTLTICPKVVLGRKGWAEDGCGGILCNNCRREFWMQEVE